MKVTREVLEMILWIVLGSEVGPLLFSVAVDGLVLLGC